MERGKLNRTLDEEAAENVDERGVLREEEVVDAEPGREED